MFILWAWTAILSGVVLTPTYTNQGNAVVPFAVVGLAVVLYTLLHPGVRRLAREVEEETRRDAGAQPPPPGTDGAWPAEAAGRATPPGPRP